MWGLRGGKIEDKHDVNQSQQQSVKTICPQRVIVCSETKNATFLALLHELGTYCFMNLPIEQQELRYILERVGCME